MDTGLTAPLHRALEPADYAWKIRYHGESDEPPCHEVEQDLTVAHEVYEEILWRLPDEVAV